MLYDSKVASCVEHPRVEVVSYRSRLAVTDPLAPLRTKTINADRATAIANVAKAFCERRWDDLRRKGLLLEPSELPSYLRPSFWTDVLVANLAHGRLLSQLLPGFELRTGEPIRDPEAARLRLRPLATITPVRKRTQDLAYSPNVIINATGRFPRLFGKDLSYTPKRLVFVELLDTACSETYREGMLRLGMYDSQRYILSARWHRRMRQYWREHLLMRMRQAEEERRSAKLGE